MSERLKEHAWKVCIREIVSWVRIPPSPPDQTTKPRLSGLCRFCSMQFQKGVARCARTLRRCTAKHSGIRAALNRPATLLFRFHPNCRQRKFRRFQTIHQAIGSGNAALRNAKRLVANHVAKAPSLANTSLGASTEDKTSRTPVRNQSALAEGLPDDKIRSPARLQAERHLVEQASVHRPLHLRGPHIAFLTPKLE